LFGFDGAFTLIDVAGLDEAMFVMGCNEGIVDDVFPLLNVFVVFGLVRVFL
jgi:hypothetical protein